MQVSSLHKSGYQMTPYYCDCCILSRLTSTIHLSALCYILQMLHAASVANLLLYPALNGSVCVYVYVCVCVCVRVYVCVRGGGGGGGGGEEGCL